MVEAQLTNLVGVSPGQAGAAPKPQQTPGAMTPPPVGQAADGAGQAPRGEPGRPVQAQPAQAQLAPAQAPEKLEGTEGLPALSPLQERAMVALLATPTVPQAARMCGVGLRTIRTWISHDIIFAERYRDGRREIMGGVAQTMQERSMRMATLIAEIAENKENPVATRLAAARMVLEFAFRGTETLDVAEQLSAAQEAAAAAERRQKQDLRTKGGRP